jgi:NDP-sugar pyrophosphorylase family protein
MKAMVLAAGLGTRLRPLTLDRPKALVEVAGRPLIAYNLSLLQHYGVRDVIINLHHHGDRLAAALGDGAALGVHIEYSREDPLLDTGGAIKNVEDLLAGEDDFLVLNADTIIDLPLDRLVASHRARRATATLVLRHDPGQERYGVIEIDDTQRIRRFLGRPPSAPADLTAYMFAGVHVLSSRALAYMTPGVAFSITRETYPAMLAAGEPLCGFLFDGFWRVIDTQTDLAKANADLRNRPVLHYLEPPR